MVIEFDIGFNKNLRAQIELGFKALRRRGDRKAELAGGGGGGGGGGSKENCRKLLQVLRGVCLSLVSYGYRANE